MAADEGCSGRFRAGTSYQEYARVAGREGNSMEQRVVGTMKPTQFGLQCGTGGANSCSLPVDTDRHYLRSQVVSVTALHLSVSLVREMPYSARRLCVPFLIVLPNCLQMQDGVRGCMLICAVNIKKEGRAGENGDCGTGMTYAGNIFSLLVDAWVSEKTQP